MKGSLPYDKADQASILAYARKIIGRSLRQAVPTTPKAKSGHKGGLGNLLEEFYFLYKPNPLPRPDFYEAGLELKATPVKKITKGYRAKERLVLNKIDFKEEYQRTFRTSSFLVKNEALLLLFYLYEKDIVNLDYVFKYADIWKYSELDLKIIEDDWNKIVEKIKAGKAHEISEGDTNYLGACTKGATAESSKTDQPFSSIKAKGRAFALKQTYVNHILEQFIQREAKRKVGASEKLVANVAQYSSGQSFEDLILKKFTKYYGKTFEEIADSFGDIDITRNAKNRFSDLSKRILGVRGKRIEEFEKANITLRTIRLNTNGMPEEAISLPSFKYKEIIKEEWETSDFREQLDKRFLFVFFQFDEDKRLVLHKAMFWNMPYQDIEGGAKKVWLETVRRIKAKKAHDLPKEGDKEFGICHVRPHARDRDDTDLTHYGANLVKKCFWLNKAYIAAVFKS